MRNVYRVTSPRAPRPTATTTTSTITNSNDQTQMEEYKFGRMGIVIIAILVHIMSCLFIDIIGVIITMSMYDKNATNSSSISNSTSNSSIAVDVEQEIMESTPSVLS